MLKPIVFSTTDKALEERSLRKFEASLHGEVIRPSDERYPIARRNWNIVLLRFEYENCSCCLKRLYGMSSYCQVWCMTS